MLVALGANAINWIAFLPGESVVPSLPSAGRSHGIGVVSGILGRLSNVAFGCRISYKNSGMMGTVGKEKAFRNKKMVNNYY